jgi:hypothetical protein
MLGQALSRGTNFELASAFLNTIEQEKLKQTIRGKIMSVFEKASTPTL